MNITQIKISEAAAILGAIGGAAGTGKAKARTREQCRAAVLKSWETKRTPMPKRFWNKVNIKGQSECWPFTDHLGTKGYGQFWLNGRCENAHRVAWEITHGKIKGGLYVLHKCDYPACCNPDHLFLGTHTDNMRDMFSKGRRKIAKGENHSRAKLSNADAVAIRRDYIPNKVTRKMLGEKYGVSVSTIKDILSRRHFSHV